MAKGWRNLAGLLLLGMLPWIVSKEYSRANTKASCHVIREAVDQFTADRKTSPLSLEEIIRWVYLRELPKGVASLEECGPTQGDSPLLAKPKLLGL